jgi:hypothetical protein
MIGVDTEHNYPYHQKTNDNKNLFGNAINKNVRLRATRVQCLSTEMKEFSDNLLHHLGHLVDGN